MSLSLETATRIVNAVIADTACQKAIQTNPTFDLFLAVPMLGLELTGTAGSARNLLMLAQGKDSSDDEFNEKICLGIALVTANAIRKAGVPNVRAVSSTHRVHWGVHHEATWIRMSDESQYVFDWHATLRLRDPLISTVDDWTDAKNSTHYVFFKGIA